MDTLTGKSRGILLRLPHFFGPAAAGELLHQFVDVFGRSLEQAESDLYQVLRAHHVQTADNEAAPLPGAAGPRRGDLDRIFSLYLEVLGGTSQLVKMSPVLTRRSLDPRRMARTLIEEEEHPLLPYLRERFAPPPGISCGATTWPTPASPPRRSDRASRWICWWRGPRSAATSPSDSTRTPASCWVASTGVPWCRRPSPGRSRTI